MLSQSRHATITVFTGAILALASLAAHAQKPALVQNIDEKGRVPYSDSSFDVPCGTPTCYVTLNPVPLGHRLVITQVSVLYAGNASSGANWVYLQTNRLSTTPSTSTYTPYLALLAAYCGTGSGGSMFLASAPVTYFVEPGMAPGFQIGNDSNGVAYISIFGYMVALD